MGTGTVEGCRIAYTTNVIVALLALRITSSGDVLGTMSEWYTAISEGLAGTQPVAGQPSVGA